MNVFLVFLSIYTKTSHFQNDVIALQAETVLLRSRAVNSMIRKADKNAKKSDNPCGEENLKRNGYAPYLTFGDIVNTTPSKRNGNNFDNSKSIPSISTHFPATILCVARHVVKNRYFISKAQSGACVGKPKGDKWIYIEKLSILSKRPADSKAFFSLTREELKRRNTNASSIANDASPAEVFSIPDEEFLLNRFCVKAKMDKRKDLSLIHI